MYIPFFTLNLNNKTNTEKAQDGLLWSYMWCSESPKISCGSGYRHRKSTQFFLSIWLSCFLLWSYWKHPHFFIERWSPTCVKLVSVKRLELYVFSYLNDLKSTLLYIFLIHFQSFYIFFRYQLSLSLSIFKIHAYTNSFQGKLLLSICMSHRLIS